MFTFPSASSRSQLSITQNLRELETRKVFPQDALPLEDLALSSLESLKRSVDERGLAFLMEEDTVHHVFSFARRLDSLPSCTKSAFVDFLAEDVSALLFKHAETAAAEFRDGHRIYVHLFAAVVYELEMGGGKSTSSTAAAAVAIEEEQGEGENDEPRKKKKAVAPKAGKKKTSEVSAFDWAASREKCMEALLSVIGQYNREDKTWVWTDLERVFDRGVPDNSFLSSLCKVAETVLSKGGGMGGGARKNSITRRVCVDLIAATAHRFYDIAGPSITEGLLQLAREGENASNAVAEILSRLIGHRDQGNFDDLRLAQLFFDQLKNDEKNAGAVLESLSSYCPQLMKQNEPSLLMLLQVQTTSVRTAVVKVLGTLALYNPAAGESGDGASAPGSVPSQESKERMLDVLMERCDDIAFNVRSAALSALTAAVEGRIVGTTQYPAVADVAGQRMRDSTAGVRAKATSLMVTLMENQHFGSSLEWNEYVELYEAMQKEIKEHAGHDLLNLSVHSPTGTNAEEDDDEDATAAVGVDGTPTTEDDEDEIVRKNKENCFILETLKNALKFVACVEKAQRSARDLLRSKTITDVVEGIRFAKTAKLCKLRNSEDGVRQMLTLIWDTREGDKIKKQVMEAFESLYVINEDGHKSKRVAEKLINSITGADQSQIASFEQCVAEAMRLGVLKRRVLPVSVEDDIFKLLFPAVSPTGPVAQLSEQNECAAVCLLGMMASSCPDILNKNSRSMYLIKLAGSPTSSYDLIKTILETFCTTFKMSPGSMCNLQDEDRRSLERVAFHLIVENSESRKGTWTPAAEKALDCIVYLSSNPEDAYRSVVTELLVKSNNAGHADVVLSSKLFFVAGHVAIKMLVLSDRLGGDMKRMRSSESAGPKKNATSQDSGEDMVGATGEDDSEDLLLRNIGDLTNPKSLLGCVCAAARQVMLHWWKSKSSVPLELLQAASLAMCKFMTVSEDLCALEASTDFLSHLQLLFTVLRDAQDPRVRSNIMIAVGDLAFRYPNRIEPFTAEVYKPLHDKDVSVRKTTLMVLIYLALNDMIKVRGQGLAEIAVCLEDYDESVRDSAKFLFTEMSKRSNNPIASSMPDVLEIVSRNCAAAAMGISADPVMEVDDTEEVAEEGSALGEAANSATANNKKAPSFRKIAEFILKFIPKEKQRETIIEKLCHRIHAACGSPTDSDIVVLSQVRDLFVCRDLTFAIRELIVASSPVAASGEGGESSSTTTTSSSSANDSLFKRLSDEWLKLYSPVLGDASVYRSMSEIIAQAKKSAKAGGDRSRSIEEWDEKVKALHGTRAEDSAAAAKAQKVGGKRKVEQEYIASSLDAAKADVARAKTERAEAEKVAKAAKLAARKKPAPRPKKVLVESENEEGEEDEEVVPVKTAKRGRVKKQDDGSDDE